MNKRNSKGLLIDWTEKFSLFTVVVSGIILLVVAAFIAFEVTMRKFFAISTSGAEEISSYALAFTSVWAFAYALIHKGHIRIDLLYGRFKNGARRFLDLLSLDLMALFVIPVTYYSFQVFLTSYQRGSRANTPLQTPLWIPQLLWLSGLVFFCLVIVILAGVTVFRLVSGNAKAAAALTGCSELQEEIEEEGGTVEVREEEGGDSL